MIRGIAYVDMAYMVQHLWNIIDDPWLFANPDNATKKERRRKRAVPPVERPDWIIYSSDGASRQDCSEDSQSSFGVEIVRDGQRLANLCVYLGD